MLSIETFHSNLRERPISNGRCGNDLHWQDYTKIPMHVTRMHIEL